MDDIFTVSGTNLMSNKYGICLIYAMQFFVGFMKWVCRSLFLYVTNFNFSRLRVNLNSLLYITIVFGVF